MAVILSRPQCVKQCNITYQHGFAVAWRSKQQETSSWSTKASKQLSRKNMNLSSCHAEISFCWNHKNIFAFSIISWLKALTIDPLWEESTSFDVITKCNDIYNYHHVVNVNHAHHYHHVRLMFIIHIRYCHPLMIITINFIIFFSAYLWSQSRQNHNFL